MEYLTQDEAIQALINGWVLEERKKGYTAYLHKGKQVISNPLRNGKKGYYKPYKFDSKSTWSKKYKFTFLDRLKLMLGYKYDNNRFV